MEKLKTKRLVKPSEWRLDEYGMEKNTLPSVTVPGESYTVQQLFQRMQNGLMPDIAKNGSFDSHASLDSDDIEKIAHLDLYERQQFQTELASQMLEKETRVKELQAEQARQKEEERQNWLDFIRERKSKKSDHSNGTEDSEKGGAAASTEAKR